MFALKNAAEFCNNKYNGIIIIIENKSIMCVVQRKGRIDGARLSGRSAATVWFESRILSVLFRHVHCTKPLSGMPCCVRCSHTHAAKLDVGIGFATVPHTCQPVVDGGKQHIHMLAVCCCCCCCCSGGTRGRHIIDCTENHVRRRGLFISKPFFLILFASFFSI